MLLFLCFFPWLSLLNLNLFGLSLSLFFSLSFSLSLPLFFSPLVSFLHFMCSLSSLLILSIYYGSCIFLSTLHRITQLIFITSRICKNGNRKVRLICPICHLASNGTVIWTLAFWLKSYAFNQSIVYPLNLQTHLSKLICVFGFNFYLWGHLFDIYNCNLCCSLAIFPIGIKLLISPQWTHYLSCLYSPS